ncbi:50S ribosomal protein L27 [Patescibacteria group bacterium]|nr:50S ribosomal protein L27 [Patescibacteria group bacterium]
MAHKKAGGSTGLGRDSQSKRLGVKLSDGQRAKKGAIIVRQRGTKFHLGKNVFKGNDDTIHAATDGIVKFATRKKRAFTGKLRPVKIVSVEPVK